MNEESRAMTNGIPLGQSRGHEMQWKLFGPEEWSAVATVVSAVIALLNLVVVVATVLYARRTVLVMKQQSADTHAQALVALETLNQLSNERRIDGATRRLLVYRRLMDLMDRLLVFKTELGQGSCDVQQYRALLPDDWHNIAATVMEEMPEATANATNVEAAIRGVQMTIQLVSIAPDAQRRAKASEQLSECIENALQALRETGGAIKRPEAQTPSVQVQCVE